MLVNTDFDVDVSGRFANPTATIEWDSLDAVSTLTFGSALVTNLATAPLDGSGGFQCADGFSEGLTYFVGAQVYVPSGQTKTGWAEILVQWYPNAGCSGGLIDIGKTSRVLTTESDMWLPISGSFLAPAGSQSARFRLTIIKQEDTGNLKANFDRVVLMLATIFLDGFESGDTTAWSSVQ